MRIGKQCLLVLAGIWLIGHISVAAESWVAQPGKSIDVEWKVPVFAGKDCWTMCWEGTFNAEGVKDEPFVKESGVGMLRMPNRQRLVDIQNIEDTAALAIREMRVFDDAGAALPGEAWKVEPSSERADVEFFHVEAIKDGTPGTAFVAAGDDSKQALNEAMPVVFTITLDHERGIGKIALRHGLQGKGRIGKLALSMQDGDGWKIIECTRSDKQDLTELKPAQPVRGKIFRMSCETMLPLFVINVDNFPRDLLKTRPFYMEPFQRRYVGQYPVPEQMDQASFKALEQEFADTHMGFSAAAEWDGNMVGKTRQAVKANPDGIAARYLPPYTNRFEAYESVKKYFEYLKALTHGSLHALSGAVPMSQYAAEWGAKIITMEITGSNRSVPVRSALLFTRSASRQYGVPWQTYCAMNFPSVGVSMGNAHAGFEKPGYGKPVSQFQREWLTGYYLGATFFDAEGQLVGTLLLKKPLETVYRLSPHGEAAKEFFNWTRSAAGARGTSYAPMLLLTDIRHGRYGRRHGSTEGYTWPMDWKIWVDLELEDGDYMLEHFVRTVDKYINSNLPQLGEADPDGSQAKELCLPKVPAKRKYVEEYFAKLDPKVYMIEHYRAPYSPNLRNSRIGEIVDIFFANPPSQGGVIKKEHLDKYAVALLMGDIEMTDALAERLKTYVKEGGTLVINSAQCKGQMADENLLGLTVGTELKEEDGMEILPVTLKTAEAVRKSEQGTPLVTRNKYGKGHVLVTTPRYMLLKDKKEPAPLIEELLAKLQDEILPIKFAGNCQFMLNKITPENWRAVLINNEGVIKHGGRSETHLLKCYDSVVTLDAPAGVQAKELFADAALDVQEEGGRTKVKVLVPAGQVRIVELSGKIAVD